MRCQVGCSQQRVLKNLSVCEKMIFHIAVNPDIKFKKHVSKLCSISVAFASDLEGVMNHGIVACVVVKSMGSVPSCPVYEVRMLRCLLHRVFLKQSSRVVRAQ